uniref:NB-ARC domain-containing protein n=1 Tax=Setaria italica TaxID=4555 RepID=K3ZMC0_SETIT
RRGSCRWQLAWVEPRSVSAGARRGRREGWGLGARWLANSARRRGKAEVSAAQTSRGKESAPLHRKPAPAIRLRIESPGEMEERFAPVTAATGALGPVLVKLAALLGDEYKLQEGTRRGIESIKSELETVHHLLGKLWGRLDLDVACKNWMTEARELSYDMEDDIDGFTLGLECGDGSFIQREATDSPFKEFMERVKDVSKRCGKMQKIGDCNRSKLPTDPRALFLHRDASELVGMEEKKEKLIKLLQKHEMVCLLGPGGMGKTTLADLVYHAVGDEFQCRTFVSVHPSPNMTDILGTILSQVITDGAMSAGSGTEPAAEQNIVTDISISLSETSSGTEPAAEQNDFIKGISNFLSDK